MSAFWDGFEKTAAPRSKAVRKTEDRIDKMIRKSGLGRKGLARAAVGLAAVSGLAAGTAGVGAHRMYKQLKNKKKDD